jgi:hypothetical protein
MKELLLDGNTEGSEMYLNSGRGGLIKTFQGELHLVYSCLDESLLIFFNGPNMSLSYQKVYGTYDEILGWFLDTSFNPFSFKWCCEMLTDIGQITLNAEFILKKIKQYHLVHFATYTRKKIKPKICSILETKKELFKEC